MTKAISPSSARPRPAARITAVQKPVISAVGEWIAAHPGTISLAQGVVGYPPPPEAVRALERFWADPARNLYQEVPGRPDLLAALEQKLRIENGLDAGGAYRVVITAGSNMAFQQALLAITDPGDEVILPAPFYFNQEMAVQIAGCRPVAVATGAGYQLDLEAIEHAITPRTRAVVSVSPNNPTGAVYPEVDLLALNRLCRQRGLYHLSDEAYEVFVYDGGADGGVSPGGARHVSPGSFPGAEENTLSFFSFSKAYGFASWRVGYVALPRHLAGAFLKVQDTNLICAPGISQYAALGALDAGSEYCREKVETLERVRGSVLAELRSLEPLCRRPLINQGALYVFLELDTPRTGFEIVERLVREHGVAPLPGETFGVPTGALRVSFGALEPATVAEGVGRLVRGVRKILEGGW